MEANRRVRVLAGVVTVLLGLSGAPSLRADVNPDGWIIDWLVYGPLSTADGCCPAVDFGRLDYLTDGVEFFEATIKPTDGLEVVPDFSPGLAASVGFHPILNGATAVWQATNTEDPAGDGSVTNVNPDTVDFNLIYDPLNFNSGNQGCPAPVENAMAYAVVYINNTSGSAISADMQLGSDDTIQVKLDDCELWINSVGRGFGAAGTVQDRVPVTLPTGAHRLLVKVWNGCGGFGFRLRFVDPTSGLPVPLGYSPDPAAPAVPDINPVGVALTHSASPDRLLGFDKPVTVTITAVKTFPGLDDNTLVTVEETLFAGTALVPGSAAPAPTSQAGSTLKWDIKVGDLVANGIHFDYQFDAPACGTDSASATVTGQYSVGAAGCLSPISGSAATAAVRLNALFLGDIVGGGDGSGSKSPDDCGIRLDTGVLLKCADLAVDNRHTDDSADPDQLNPQPVEEAPYVDSVFFMLQETMAINSKGVEYTFQPGDLNPTCCSWNHILSNITHDIDKGVGNIVCGGKGPFATGVGVHASAGVTFNLNALRKAVGADKVVSLSSRVGIDGCAGHIRTYIIYSDDTQIYEDNTWMGEFTANQGEDYQDFIPPDAKYVTFATGTAGDGDGCDHGVWAEARIFPDLPIAVILTDTDKGPQPLTVNFNGGSSTAPAGSTITCYLWDFGDGSTGSGATAQHVYQKRGKYTAKLTVETSKGLSASVTKQIEATFACGNVAPYASQDVGAPTLTGCARPDGGCLVLFGGGKEIGGRSDQFQFVHKTKAGDVSLTAQVKDIILDSRAGGRAGLMFRDGTAADAAFGYIHVFSSLTGFKAAFLGRVATGQPAQGSSGAVFVPPDAYLRLDRAGADLIGYTSPTGLDGSWTELKRATLTVPPAQLLAGLAVTSADRNSVGLSIEATFCNVEFSDEVVPPEDCNVAGDEDQDGKADCADEDCANLPKCLAAQFYRGDADDNGQLQLTDAIRVLGFLFLGGAPPTCLDAGDADGNNTLQLTDAIRILGFLFLGGAAPAPPGPPGQGQPCGPDNDATSLGCASYTHC